MKDLGNCSKHVYMFYIYTHQYIIMGYPKGNGGNTIEVVGSSHLQE